MVTGGEGAGQYREPHVIHAQLRITKQEAIAYAEVKHTDWMHTWLLEYGLHIQP